VVLAAGRAQRMGTLKQTLPWPPAVETHISNLESQASRTQPAPLHHRSTIIACAFDAIAPFCDRMFVVVGAHADDVLAALGDRAFTRVDADSDDEMLASIRAGLHAVLAHRHSDLPFDAVLLQPADCPNVVRATIEALLAAWRSDPDVALMPEYHGRGGHPALIPRRLLSTILNHQGDGGLRQFWIDHASARRRLAVGDPRCVGDLDTPEEYQAAWRGRQG
jgi:molybdenum cofactor cytidylyltransferase